MNTNRSGASQRTMTQDADNIDFDKFRENTKAFIAGRKLVLKQEQGALEDKKTELFSKSVAFQKPNTTTATTTTTTTTTTSVSMSEREIRPLVENEAGEEEAEIEIDLMVTGADLQDNQMELHALENEEHILEDIHQGNNQITMLDRFFSHCQDIFKREGTTTVSAAVTAGVGIVAGTAAATTLGGVAAVGAAATAAVTGFTAASEIYKMLLRHVEDIGADEPIKVIESALENIEQQNHDAKEAIENAQGLQKEIYQKVEDAKNEILALTAKLSDASEASHDIIHDAIAKLNDNIELLKNQGFDLERAIQSSQNALVILKEQKGMFKDLLERKFDNNEPLDKVLAEIKQQITQIQSLSTASNQHILTAVKFQNKALTANVSAKSMVKEIEMLLGELEILEQHKAQLAQAYHAQAEALGEAEKKIQEQGGQLENAGRIMENQQTDIEIGKYALAKQKASDDMSQSTIAVGTKLVYGVPAAVGAGLGIAIAGTGIGMVGIAGGLALGAVAEGSNLNYYVLRGVRFAKKTLKGDQEKMNQIKIDRFNSDLDSSRFEGQKVSVTAEFGNTTGTYKSLAYGMKYVGSSLSSWFASPSEDGTKSETAGSVNCMVGNVPLSLNFTTNIKTNTTYIEQGAIPFHVQQELSHTLESHLKAGHISAQMVLDLLDQLSKVQVDETHTIVMVDPYSLAFQNLRRACEIEVFGSPQTVHKDVEVEDIDFTTI